jgi:sulfotransferase family protein
MIEPTRDARHATRSGTERPRALFIVGPPRSGTTLIGNYLGSSAEAFNLGEFGGFHLAHTVAPGALGLMPSGPYRDEYLADLTSMTRRFAEEIAVRYGRRWYCDAAPANNAGASSMAATMPDAVFVLTLRHYAGNIQSLRRAFASGGIWAGRTWEESAAVWVAAYQNLLNLPDERVVPFGYDRLAASPDEALASLRDGLAVHGFDTGTLDAGLLAVSHGTQFNIRARPTVAVRQDGAPRLAPFSSVDVDRWGGDIHRAVWPIVRDVHHELLRRFPGMYVSPPPPMDMRAHDEIEGSIPFEREGW